jgi:hypothetical protein
MFIGAHFPRSLIDSCRDAFWPILRAYLEAHGHGPNRGLNRHFLPMPFEPPCFAPAFFFDDEVLSIVSGAMDDRIVADQWGCDAALHRGTSNRTETPRALVTVRYVRRWYTENSREVNSIPRAVWGSLTPEQRSVMRFPIED